MCGKTYQAFPNEKWPVEIQVMSRLWDFWAEYSREYFYGREGSTATNYLPYNIAISKILDSADDLMTVTTERIRQEAEGDSEASEPVYEESEHSTVTLQQEYEGQITSESVRKWFEANVSNYFGNARIPGEFFLSKIAEELSVYRIDLDKLAEILADGQTDNVYREILRRSTLQFLPPHEQILLKVLLNSGRDEASAIDEVNQELRRLGIVLYRQIYN